MRIQARSQSTAANCAPRRAAARAQRVRVVLAARARRGQRRAGRRRRRRAVGGIDALVALQGVEDPTERRRRAVKRGRDALDVLDDLKLGLLGGTLDPAALKRLKAAAAELTDDPAMPGSIAVLAEIELRVEVELAKAGRS